MCWKKKRDKKFIVKEGEAMDNFEILFDILRNSTYDLVIKEVNFSNSGTYFCSKSMDMVSQEYTGIEADVIVVGL